MPEINFEQMRNAARAVFEEGTLKTKQGYAVPARHVVQVIQVVAELLSRNDYAALQELRIKMIGVGVSDGTIEAIGADTAHDILEDGHFMTAATSEIIKDIVKGSPLERVQIGMPSLDVSHYEEQFNERARAKGGAVRFNPPSGKFQAIGLG